MKDAYYFPHDSNAKDDPKCVLLIEQLGLEGYGIFWVLVETLRDQPNYMYPLSLVPALARRYNTTPEKMRAVIEKYGLFSITEDNQFFFSHSLNRRMLKANEKREKLRANALKRWHGNKHAEVMQLHSKSNTDLMPLNKSKVNEIKVNEIKENNNISTTTGDVDEKLINPDLAEINQYWNDNISPITPAIAQEFNALLQKGVKAEIIIAAISEAIRSATGRPSYNYVKTIIDRWIAQGIDTLAKVKEDREKHRTKANGKGAIEYEVGKDGIKHDSAGHVIL